MVPSLAFVYHPEMLEHRPPGLAPELRDYHARKLRRILGELVTASRERHPERPERLSSLVDHVRLLDSNRITWLEPDRASEEMVLRAHTPPHLRRLHELKGGNRMLSLDTTAVSPGSIDAAFRAAGAAVTAVEFTCSDPPNSAFALVRPPGHHASAAHYRGFCLINNVAVAARHAMAECGIERVLVIDWDVHHGNGTASIFESDPNVLFFDVHRAAPFYPGTGMLGQIGRGAGRGSTMNVPLPGGSGDLAVLQAFDDILLPAARRFRPGLILVSAGFDGTREHLACRFSTGLYAHLTQRLHRLAAEICDGRLAMVLEGGYHVLPMRQALEHCVRVLIEPDVKLPPLQKNRIGLPAVREARDYLAANTPWLRNL